jgi:acetylornithine deacetylase/succinyl-diaminopimelate desuccinylase-like protein
MNPNTYIDQHRERFLAELFDLIRIPSVSTDKTYLPDVARAADFLRDRLQEAGADLAEVMPTSGNPVVYAEKIIDPSLPTVLVYGHYDVQPADPLELWDSPPFEPTIRNGKIFARGACDDKGQMYMHVKAFELLVKTQSLPCNVKFMLEGEEETGSPSLPEFLRTNRQKLAADVIILSDTSMIDNDTPSISVGLRGLAYLQVEVTAAARDLHSGIYGGAVYNPINVLCQMIASLKDAHNRVTVPGFYDKVAELSAQERAKLAEAPFDRAAYLAEGGFYDLVSEQGYSPMEGASIRPTLDVNGIWGGYTGEGSKTVIPAKAFAKISMRLVPHQDYHEISELFAAHFQRLAPSGVRVKVTPHHGGEPIVTPTDSVAYRAAELAFEKAFQKQPIPQRGGGSIPIIPMFKRVLGLDAIMMGFGLDSDALHSPNENFGLFNFFKGIETIPYFYQYYAELMKK